jgi:uncharacterized membrane protein YbhN (UPF0104 family)
MTGRYGGIRWATWLRPTLVATVVLLALVLLYRRLQPYSMAEIRFAVGSLSRYRLGLAAVLTALSYTVLTGYDVLALHHYGIRLAYRTWSSVPAGGGDS